MRNLNFSLSTRLFLMLSLAIPGIFAIATPAEAKPAKQSNAVQNKPFIREGARRDTLGNLNKAPIGNVIRANDGGTGKEACDKGKDACDGFANPTDRVTLPVNKIKVPILVPNTKSKQLIRSTKPIF